MGIVIFHLMIKKGNRVMSFPNIAAMDKLGDVADFVSCANKIRNVPLKKVLSDKARGRTPNVNCAMFGWVGLVELD